jgi:hypothetical protein
MTRLEGIRETDKRLGRERMKYHEVLTEEWFNEAFANIEIPADIRSAAERLVRSYGIGGICDPLYIANVIAKEIGRGDGLSHFPTIERTK